MKKTIYAFIFAIILSALGGVILVRAQVFNPEINYQGKLANSSNSTVSDGSYGMQFSLYTSISGGSPIWTETWCDTSTCDGNGGGYDNRIKVTSGLFSVMLGSTTAFTGVNFNQPLYLGVTIGGPNASTSWDGEMTPRKIIGAVPAAFFAGTSTVALSANALSGLSSSEFLRSDAQNATSSTNTFLSVLQSGVGKVAEFFGSATQSVLALLSNGNVGIGTSTPGSMLAVAGSAAGTTALFSVSTSTATFATTTAVTIDQNGNLALLNGANATITGNSTVSGTASSSNAVVSNSFTLGNMSGLLWGTSGAVSAVSTSSLGLLSFSTTSAAYWQTQNNFFSTTSAAYWQTQNNFFSTTSASYFLGLNQGNAFSTTSSNYWLTLNQGNAYSTTSAAYWLTQQTVAVANGGTGQTSFGQGWLGINDSGAFISSTSPTVNYIVATSTTATSTIGTGGFAVGGNYFLVQQGSGNVGIGTTSPFSNLSVSTAAQQSGSMPLFTIASTTNANLFTVLGNGNVGIGTTSPTNRLEVAGNTFLGGNLTATGTFNVNNVFTVDPTNGATAVWLANSSLKTFDVNYSGALVLSAKYNGLALNVNGGAVPNTYTISGGSNVNNLTISTTANNAPILLMPNGTGNVGIGTTTPKWNLQVAGVAPSIALTDTNAGNNQQHWLFSSMGGNLYIGTTSNAYATSTPSAMTILNNGTIGIGKYPSGSLASYGVLQVSGKMSSDSGYFGGQNIGNFTSKNYSNANTSYYGIQNAASVDMAVINNFATGYLYLGSGNKIGMTMDPSNNVGIGVASPVAVLDIDGPMNTSALSAPATPTIAAKLGDGGSCNVGTHTWKLTFLNVAGETTPSPASAVATCTAASSTAPLTIVVGPAGTMARKIYRTIAGNTGNYLLVTTINDNTTTTYNDNNTDASLGAAAPSSNTTAIALFQVGGTTMMDINPSGNVGIGTTSPLARLDVVGAASAALPLFQVSSLSSLYATATAMIVNSSGQVGIGTTSPYSMLSVAGQVAAQNYMATSTTIASSFQNASTTMFTDSGSLYLTALGQGWLSTAGGTNALTSSTSPTVNYITATSTTATSTFQNLIANQISGSYLMTTSVTATSTFAGGLSASIFNATSATASSTFTNGVNLTNGCYSINGSCIGTTTGTVTSVQASGGTTGLSFTGGPVTSSGVLTLGGTLGVGYGGTGITNTPSYGQLLMGQSNGTYALTGTSSLGLLSFSTTSSNYWLTQNTGNAFSSTSVNYWDSTQSRWATTSTNYWLTQQTVAVANGGTGQTSFGQGWLGINDSGAFVSSTSPTAAWFTATSTRFASQFPYASSTAITVSGEGYFGTASTTNLNVSGSAIFQNLAGASTRCLQVNSDGTISANALACAAAVAAGTWATSTSQVSGEAINYPSNNMSTDIVAIGGNSTTTAKVWFDPTALTSFFKGNVGIGTTSPWTNLSVNGSSDLGNFALAGYFNATNTAATSTFAGGVDIGNGSLKFDVGAGVTSISNLQLGNISFDTDAGVVSWMDLPVDANVAGGVAESYSASVGGNPLLTIYSQANGLGGIQNGAVGIGTTSPFAMLSVQGNSFVAGNVTASNFIATSSVASQLPYASTTMITATTASTTNLIVGNLNGLLFGTNGAVSSVATSSLGLLGSSTVSSLTNNYLPKWNSNGTFGNSLLFDNGTNVGIGTSSPWATLSVSSSSSATAQLTPMFVVGTSTPSLFVDQNGYVAIGTSTPSTLIPAGTNEFSVVNANNATNIANFYNNNGTSELSISNSGLMIAPNGAQLQIGVIQTSGGVNLSNSNNVASLPIKVTNNGFSADTQDWNNKTGTIAEINSFGFLGIGTTSPQAWLSVVATSTTNGPTVMFGHATNGAASTTDFMVAANGNVGIGTTSPFSNLSVSTAAQQSGSMPLFTIASTTNANLFTVLGNGNVGIGTTSPTNTLEVAGSGYFGGNVTSTGTIVSPNGVYKSLSTNNTSFSFIFGTTPSLIASGGQQLRWDGAALYPAGSATLGSAANPFGNGYFSGNVGIGTTSPFARLSVAGAAAGTTALFSVSTSTATFATTTAVTIDQNGNLALLNGANATITGNSTVSGTASSSNAVVSNSFTLGNMNGVLWGTNGAVSTVSTSSLGLLSFSTTSAAYWQIQNNFFSTTSAAYWQTQNNFFSTTSSAYWLTQNTGNAFSTTSSNYWLTQNIGNAFSTTSSNYWLTQNQGNAFSSTSANYWLTQNTGNAFSTTSSNYWLTLNQGNAYSTTSAAYWLTQQTVAVANGGTGQTSFGQGWLGINNSGAFISSTSPTVNYFTATSTTATSTIGTGGFAVGGNYFLVQHGSGNVGIGTTSPFAMLSVQGNSFIAGNETASNFIATSTAASSTLQNLTANQVAATYFIATSTTATSTFANGINLTKGCYAVNSTCLSTGGSGSGTVNSGNSRDLAWYSDTGTAVSGNDYFTVDSLGGISAAGTYLTVDDFGNISAHSLVLSNDDSLVTDGYASFGTSNHGMQVDIYANQDSNFDIGDSTTDDWNVSNNGIATFAGLTLSNITGSTQCLQANSSGAVSGTACGGGTPNSKWATSTDNTSIYNDQSGGKVGVATSSPWGALSVGVSSFNANQPMFVIGSTTASGTGTSTPFEVDGYGNTWIGTSTPKAAYMGNLLGQLNIAMATGTEQGLVIREGVTTTGNPSPFFTMYNNIGSSEAILSDSGSLSLTGSISAALLSETNTSASGVNTLSGTDAQTADILDIRRSTLPVDVFNNLGYEGIGTTSPQAWLSVVATSTTNGPTVMFGHATNGAASTTDFIVSNTGNVGVGTTSPGSLFSVAGIANLTAATSTFYGSGGINITRGCFSVNGACVGAGGGGGGSGTVNSGTTGHIAYYTGGTAVSGDSGFTTDGAGNLLVNSISDPTGGSVWTINSLGYASFQGGDPYWETYYPYDLQSAITSVATATPMEKRGGGSIFYDKNNQALEFIDQNTSEAYKFVMDPLASVKINFDDASSSSILSPIAATSTKDAISSFEAELAAMGGHVADIAGSSGQAADLASSSNQISLQALQESNSLETNYQALNANFQTLSSSYQSLASEIDSLTASSSAVLASTTDIFGAQLADMRSDIAGLPASSTFMSSLADSIEASSTFMSSLASSTADMLLGAPSTTPGSDGSAPSFMGRIVQAVLDALQSAANVIVQKVTASFAVFNRVQTQTAAVTNGLEMTDSATGQVYCVRITNGDFAKTAGSCDSVASTTPAVTTAVPAVTTSNFQAQSTNFQISSNDQNSSSNSTSTATGTASSGGMILTASTTPISQQPLTVSQQSFATSSAPAATNDQVTVSTAPADPNAGVSAAPTNASTAPIPAAVPSPTPTTSTSATTDQSSAAPAPSPTPAPVTDSAPAPATI